jgi:hypothetical protein
LLAYCRGIVAAVPKLAKVKVLEEKAKRCGTTGSGRGSSQGL